MLPMRAAAAKEAVQAAVRAAARTAETETAMLEAVRAAAQMAGPAAEREAAGLAVWALRALPQQTRRSRWSRRAPHGVRDMASDAWCVRP